MKKPEVVVEWMVSFDEAMATMDEYVNSIVIVGKLPSLESTNHLGEETDEGGEEVSEPSAKERVDQKPELTLIPGNRLGNPAVLKALFKKLTGREATDEDVEEAMNKIRRTRQPLES